MEFNDWNGRGKDRLTTPGGPFQPPAGSGRRYEYDRADAPRRDAPVKPQARTAETPPAAQAASPFAPAEAPRPWYAETEEAARREAAPVVLSHDGARLEASLEQEGPGPVYTVRLPAQPKPAPAKGRSLWWVAPAWPDACARPPIPRVPECYSRNNSVPDSVVRLSFCF